MNIAYFPNQTALQSEPVWQGFLESCKKHGMTPVENAMDADAAVIWSMLWHGRMKENRQVYQHYQNQGKPVFILEVGALKRGVTWKVALNNITRNGIYADHGILDLNRHKKISVNLEPVKENRKKEILIAGQHILSHQWEGQPSVQEWLDNIISQIRQHTDRPIVVRPHPRFPFSFKNTNARLEMPKRRSMAVNDFDFEVDYHCIVNHNSGPSIQAPLNGTPVICDSSSLAWPVSSKFEEIDKILLPDREDWFLKLCHTEWTVEEIRAGIPLSRLLPYLKT